MPTEPPSSRDRQPSERTTSKRPAGARAILSQFTRRTGDHGRHSKHHLASERSHCTSNFGGHPTGGSQAARVGRDTYADLESSAPASTLLGIDSSGEHESAMRQQEAVPSSAGCCAASGAGKSCSGKAPARLQQPADAPRKGRRMSFTIGRTQPPRLSSQPSGQASDTEGKSIGRPGQASDTEGKNNGRRKRRTSVSTIPAVHLSQDDVPTNMQDFIKDVLRRAREETERYETAFNYHQRNKDKVSACGHLCHRNS